MTDILHDRTGLPEAAPATLSPEWVARVCGQTRAEPVKQLFAALDDAAPAVVSTTGSPGDDALREAAAQSQQRWFETMLRGALPAAVRTGSVAHLTRVREHLAALPLSDAFKRQAEETAALQGAATGCVEAVMALVSDAPDDAMALAAATAAAAAGRIAVLQALVEDGLSDEAISRALIAAAASEHLGAVMALLLAAGDRAGSVAQTDFGGITAIGAAARVGALDVVRELWPWQGTATRASALVNAASEGFQAIVAWVLSQEAPGADSDDAPIWQAGLGQALRAGAAGGHDSIVQTLLTKLGHEPALPLLEEAFFAAAAQGHAPILATLHQAAGHRGDALLAARSEGVLQVAANAGQVDAIRWILDAVGPRRQRILRADDDGAFCSAAAQGHVDAARCLLEQVSEADRPAMLAAYQWEPLREAAAAGHLGMVQWVLEALPAVAQLAVQAEDYEAFRRAAAGGHGEVVTYLLGRAEDGDAMLASRNFAAITQAAQQGHGDVVATLLGTLGDDAVQKLAEHGTAVLMAAAKSGCLAMLVHLLERLQASAETEKQAGVTWMTTHFLAMPGEPERHAPLRKHMDRMRAWAGHLDENVLRQALAVALADGEPELAALFSGRLAG